MVTHNIRAMSWGKCPGRELQLTGEYNTSTWEKALEEEGAVGKGVEGGKLRLCAGVADHLDAQ